MTTGYQPSVQCDSQKYICYSVKCSIIFDLSTKVAAPFWPKYGVFPLDMINLSLLMFNCAQNVILYLTLWTFKHLGVLILHIKVCSLSTEPREI